MKTLKFQVDDKVAESLDELAEQLGMKTNAYIQLILGKHVLAMQAGRFKEKKAAE